MKRETKASPPSRSRRRRDSDSLGCCGSNIHARLPKPKHGLLSHPPKDNVLHLLRSTRSCRRSSSRSLVQAVTRRSSPFPPKTIIDSAIGCSTSRVCTVSQKKSRPSLLMLFLFPIKRRERNNAIRMCFRRQTLLLSSSSSFFFLSLSFSSKVAAAQLVQAPPNRFYLSSLFSLSLSSPLFSERFPFGNVRISLLPLSLTSNSACRQNCGEITLFISE